MQWQTFLSHHFSILMLSNNNKKGFVFDFEIVKNR